MNAVTFDTYQLISDLKGVGFNERQAEAVVNTIKKAHKDADVATKGDIKELRHEMRELEHRLTNQLTMRFGVMLATAVGMLSVLMKIL